MKMILMIRICILRRTKIAKVEETGKTVIPVMTKKSRPKKQINPLLVRPKFYKTNQGRRASNPNKTMRMTKKTMTLRMSRNCWKALMMTRM